MTRPRAVLLDCDGVITDSETLSFRLIQADLAGQGMHLTLEELETNWIGGIIEMTADRVRAAGIALPSGWVAAFCTKLIPRCRTGRR